MNSPRRTSRIYAWIGLALGLPSLFSSSLALAAGPTTAPEFSGLFSSKPKDSYRRSALRQEGNPDRGQRLFASEDRLACTKCHTTDGSAAKVGPDLFAVGDKFGRRDIIEAVLSPSAFLAEGYAAVTVNLKSGDTLQGQGCSKVGPGL